MWRLGIRFLLRDWRGGELALLLSGLILSVATVTSLTAFVERVQSAFIKDSAAFLAADLVVLSPRDDAQVFQQQAQSLGLEQSQQTVFATMTFAGDQFLLVSVKAIDANYPLRGALKISEQPFQAGRVTKGAPASGTIWVSTRVLTALAIAPGQSVEIGNGTFRVAGVIQEEPDGRPDVFSAGPRVLMNQIDLQNTGVVQPGSRVKYRYLFAGDAATVSKFGKAIEKHLTPSQRVLDVTNNRPPVASAIDRAEDFLLLSGSIAVLLAGVALSLSARHYSKRHFSHAALMKTLGATSGQVSRIYFSLLSVFGVLASLIGVAVGYGVQSFLLEVVAQLLETDLPAPGVTPGLIGMATGVICLCCFAWPPLVAVSRISPLNVFRDQANTDMADGWFYGIGGLAMFGLMWWYSGSLSLAFMLFAGAGVVIGGLVGLGFLLIRGLRRVSGKTTGFWRWGVIAIARHGKQNAVQIVVFSLTLMSILVVYQVRTGLLDQWKNQLPEFAPNHFLVNIAPYEREPLEEFLKSNQVDTAGVYPIVRGRLTHINDNKVTEAVTKEDREKAGVERELNLTFTDTMPKDNKLLQGQWWQAGGTLEQVSVESRLAERMGIALNDRLTFTVGADRFVVTVTSIRSVDWDTMQPNFYMIFPPGFLDDYPSTYITSFYLPKDRKPLLNALTKAFPTVSVIEVDAILDKIQNIVQHVSRTIEWILGFIAAGGALVLIAGVRSTMPMRYTETALLRAMGATRRRVVSGVAMEFCVLGGVSALVGSLSAVLTLYAVQRFWFNMQADVAWWVALWGGGMAMVLIAAVGIGSVWSTVNTSPMVVLRNQG